MAIDEIQTGFWFPEVIYCSRIGLQPDFIVLGKGMTAGFHPLAALIYRGKLDVLEQYDAISTNGNAALAALLALGCIELIERARRGRSSRRTLRGTMRWCRSPGSSATGSLRRAGSGTCPG
jgi:acetylornithine/succinyldiaminopimelate/putrescine aminotransferase